MTTPEPPGLTDTELAQLRSRVLTSISGSSRRRHGRIAVVAGGLVVAVAATAGAVAIQPASVTEQNAGYTCYYTANPNGPSGGVMGPEGAGDQSHAKLLPLQQRIDRALELCGLHYSGRESTLPGARLVGTPVDVPNPTVCLLRDLRLGVFPNPKSEPAADFCKSLGLTTP